MPAGDAQVSDQHGHRIVAVLRVRTQDGGWMKGRHRRAAELRLEKLSVILHHPSLRADHRSDRSRPEADQKLGVDDIELGLEPGGARLDLLGAGVWWIRRLPFGVHLKCLTTLVT